MSIIKAFLEGFRHISRKKCNEEAKALRENLSQEQVDDMVASSMDASDPPSTY